MNKKLIAPIVTAAAMLATSIGSTFALFSSKASSKIDINAGRVAVNYDATVSKALSRYLDEEPWDAIANKTEAHAATFENGSTADISVESTGAVISLDRLAPMDMIELKVGAENDSNINIKFRYFIKASGDLLPALDLIVDGASLEVPGSSLEFYSAWSSVMTPDVESLFEKNIGIYFPDHGEDDNQYQEKTATLEVGIEAIQGNAEVHDPVNPEAVNEPEEIHSKKPSAAGKSVNMESKTGSQSYVVPFEACDESAEELVLTIIPEEEPTAEVPAGKDVLPYDIHIEGIKEDNTAEIEARIGIGQGKTNVQVFHNGAEIQSKYVEDEGSVYFKATSFSPYDVVFDSALESGYGFHNSYKVDEGLETEHWVHEISNAEEFRNIMDSTTHDKKAAQFDYPGAGKKETVYLITQPIDFGGGIYSAAQIEEVKAAPFTGILRGESPEGKRIVLSNVHLTEIMETGINDHTSIWGLFDGVLNAKFESFTIKDFTIDNDKGKSCGFIAAGQNEQNLKSKNPNYDNTAYVHCEDIIVSEDCSVTGNGNCSSFFGILRSLDDVKFINCVNQGDVYIGANNAGGFSGDISYSDPSSEYYTNFPNHTLLVENCVNSGHITAGTKGYVSGLFGYNLHYGTISNFTNNGIIEVVGNGGSDIGVATGRSSNATVTYENVVQNGYIKYTGTLPQQAQENKSENRQVFYTNGSGELVSGFDSSAKKSTQDYLDRTYLLGDAELLSLSFDNNGTLTVGDNSLTNISKIDVALLIGRHSGDTDTGIVLNSNSTANYQVYFEEIESVSGTTAELSAKGLKKVNQIGYFAPEGVTPVFPAESWGRIGKYVEQFHLDSALYGTEGYTDADLGYGINSKGGYVLVKDGSSTNFTVITPLHEDPHFVIRAYDANGKLVAFGDLYSGRIVGEHVPEDIHVTAGIDKYVYLG